MGYAPAKGYTDKVYIFPHSCQLDFFNYGRSLTHCLFIITSGVSRATRENLKPTEPL